MKTKIIPILTTSLGLVCPVPIQIQVIMITLESPSKASLVDFTITEAAIEGGSVASLMPQMARVYETNCKSLLRIFGV